MINELKLAFQNVNKTIVQNFTEKTLNFLKDLKEKESHGFKFYLLSLKMSTVKINDRVCYDLRGLSNSEAVILDDNYKNKYLSYLEKKELIEKNCKFNGGLDEENCIYDLSEIEPVENKSIVEIFKNCFSKHEFALSKKLLYEFSLLENPEDFDINSIFNKIKKNLDKLNSFEELVTKYLFKKLNINSYHKNLENMNILNITEIKNQDTNNTQSYNDYIRELLLKLFRNLYSDYFISNNYVKQKRNDLDLLYKLKNEFYRNYSSGYKENINYFIKNLKTIKVLNPSLKNTIKNVFSEVEENRNLILDNWEINFNNIIENYYKKDFPELINSTFFSFVEEHFIKNWTMDYFLKKYNIIVKDNSFESNFKEIINSLSSDIKVTYKNKDDFEKNSMNSLNNENDNDFNFSIKELNDTLINIEDYKLTEIGKSIVNFYENELKNFSLALEINISYDGINELNNDISIFDDLCNKAYNDSFIDSCKNSLFSFSFPTVSEEEINNFTKTLIGRFSTILKDIYKEENQLYEDLIPPLTRFIETMFSDLNKAFERLPGYTIIDGFNYIEEPCKDSNSNCSYRIDYPSFLDMVKQESKKKNGRRLEEKDYIRE